MPPRRSYCRKNSWKVMVAVTKFSACTVSRSLASTACVG